MLTPLPLAFIEAEIKYRNDQYIAINHRSEQSRRMRRPHIRFHLPRRHRAPSVRPMPSPHHATSIG
jgi:hypothetical protein